MPDTPERDRRRWAGRHSHRHWAATLVALFMAHRSATAGRLLLGAAALVMLGFGLDGFREPTAALWVTVVISVALLFAATPFFGPLPRARHTA
jgi:hypothetical protein